MPTECLNIMIQLCTSKTNHAVGLPVISYTVEILLNCEWLLRIPQGVINWKRHPVLKHLPVSTIDDIKEVTDTIDYSKHCPGINDAKFNEVKDQCNHCKYQPRRSTGQNYLQSCKLISQEVFL